MMADLTARIAELAALIEANLAGDEEAARESHYDGQRWITEEEGVYRWPDDEMVHHADRKADARHIARQDPARVLRRVKATRELVSAITAELHDYIPGDEFYSCSQAIDPYPGESGEPGSGCSDPERAGKPCDCGRDARVARMLGIIASEWEG